MIYLEGKFGCPFHVEWLRDPNRERSRDFNGEMLIIQIRSTVIDKVSNLYFTYEEIKNDSENFVRSVLQALRSSYVNFILSDFIRILKCAKRFTHDVEDIEDTEIEMVYQQNEDVKDEN